MKKLAVVASGWHYPLHFYESLLKQQVPEGWEVDYFCVSHRDPSYAQEEKAKDFFLDDERGRLDKILYKEIATKKLIQNLGWHYKEYPNTIGDWGNSNQWLADNDYRKYKVFLFTHDDNLILNDRLFADVIEDKAFKQWHILTNSPGAPAGSLRGSFEFFKLSVMRLLKGRFDLSTTELRREGKFDNPENLEDLNDWNNIVFPLNKFITKHKLKVAMLSPAYRVSAYVIEGERGYISRTHGQNTQFEDAGLAYLKQNGII